MDTLHRFLIEDTGIRGNLVYLDATWRAVLDIHPYPEPVRRQLGEAMAAVLLLSATIKLDGSLILQAQGDGPLGTLVVQANHRRMVRGLAHWSGSVPPGGLSEVFGDGYLALTIDPTHGERYQGIVPLEGPDLATALWGYFEQSEQLPTRLWLMAEEQRAAGLLLQRLPTQGGDNEDWQRISLLAETLTPRELIALSPQELLYRLFNQESVRLFESEPVAFRCTCSRQRVEDTLRTLGRDELESILNSSGSVAVDCEFCNRHYLLDSVDVQRLFAEGVPHASARTVH